MPVHPFPKEGLWFAPTSIIAPIAPKTRDERVAMLAIFLATSAVLILLAIYYILNPRNIVGDSLVNTAAGTPNEFPSPQLSPFYLKPVTVFFIAVVLCSYSFFALIQKPALWKLPRSLLHILLIVFLVAFAMSVYEVLFNFSYWVVVMETGVRNPDLAVNNYPVASYQVNLVFATKAFLALVFVTYFGLTSLRNSIAENENT